MFACNLAQSLVAARNIYCSGFKSCYISNKIEARNVICSGSTSCDHRVNPDAPIQARNFLYCDGQEACYSSSLISDQNTYCEGLHSCAESTITSGINILYIYPLYTYLLSNLPSFLCGIMCTS